MFCTVCNPGYYLDSNNKCTSYKDKIKTYTNCQSHFFNISNVTFDTYYEDNDLEIYIDSNEKTYYDNFSIFNEALKNSKGTTNTTCLHCNHDYFADESGECIYLNLETCNLENIIGKSFNFFFNCEDKCENNNFPYIYLKFNDYSIDLNESNYLNNSNVMRDANSVIDVFYAYLYGVDFDEETKQIIYNIPMCYDISDVNLKNKYRYCNKIIYIPTNKTYQCLECSSGYDLINNASHSCVYHRSESSDSWPCNVENIGTE